MLGSVGNILKVAAPILMGVLGKQKQQNNVSSSNDLGGLLRRSYLVVMMLPRRAKFLRKNIRC